MIDTRNLRRSAARGLAALAAVGLTAGLLQPQAGAQPEADATQTPGEAYESMGFGVFMHYGLATFVAQTPWAYDPDDVPATVYDPPDFDPDQWMDAVAAAGANYVIFTAKHHDGFTLWPSEYSDYGVQSSSDPETDVVGEVVRAARERDLKVVLYYSWYEKLHPGGEVRPKDPNSDRTTDSPEYMAYVKNQLTELLTDYGHIEGIWLDIAPMDDVQLPELAEHIQTVSPGTALVPNFPNAIRDGNDAADVVSFEGPYEMMPCDYDDTKPTEQAFTVASGPGWWQASDEALPGRDTDAVLSVLSATHMLGATFSLNVSPGPSGRIPAGGVRLLEALGDRLDGDDLLADGTTTASGDTSDHPAGHATDLLTRTRWQVPSDGGWLQVDMGQPLTIDRTAVQFTSDDVAGYEIQYADADGNWRNAHTGGVPDVPTQTDEFPAVTTDSLRLVVEGAADGATDVGVIEFKAYGGIDDTSSAAIYAGDGWQALSRSAGSPDVPRLPPSVPFSGAFNESIHRSRTAGDTAEFTFTGNAVQLHAGTGPDQGIARVSVDGAAPEKVELYAPETGRDQVVYRQDGLDPGEHTVTVQVTGEQHQDSTGSWVTVDRVTPLDVASSMQDDSPHELPDGRLIYDDGGNRCATDTPIEYTGSWTSGGWDGAYDSTRHYSRTPGDHAELTFEGTGVAVMTQTRPGHGIAAISVDGGEPELVDTYADPAQEQVVVWEKSGLESGEHTVRIEVTGDKNPAATNTWVAVDAVIVTP